MSKRPAKTARTVRQAQRGKDGLTLGERIRRAMREHSPPMTESALLAACDAIAQGALSQQLLNQILLSKNSRSAAVPVIAEALGVRAVWLSFGIGEVRGIVPNVRGPMSHRDRADKAFMEAFRDLPKEWEFTVRSIVGTLAVAMRESHGEFAKMAAAKTQDLLQAYGAVHDE